MKNPRSFAIPVLGRYGLTHGLLAWARCRIWCEQNNATMLAPFWLKLRVGPYLRRERDKRNYFLLFRRGTALGGWRRLALLTRTKQINVGTEWPTKPKAGGRSLLLRFHNAVKNNERKSFAQIIGHGPFLRQELLAMTRTRFHPAQSTEPFIAIHVRLGDFIPLAANRSVPLGATNARLPIDWYEDRLDAMRRGLGRQVHAIVFSDGSDTDLATLLARDAVTRAPKQQSVTDLLQIGLAAAVIASGSGFSLWGAFLGSAPRLAYPGQAIVPIEADRTRDIESAFGTEIDATFLAHVDARMRI